MPSYEKYELSLSDIVEWKEYDLASGEEGNPIKKYVYEDGLLQEYTKKTISGKYTLVHISGFQNGNGQGVADMFCAMDYS